MAYERANLGSEGMGRVPTPQELALARARGERPTSGLGTISAAARALARALAIWARIEGCPL